MGTKPKSTAGRPTVFRSEYIDQAHKLCDLGATEGDLARFFNVNVTTIWRWRSKYPAFCNALKVGKHASDDRTEASLFHRANGYSYEAVKIFPPSGTRKKPLIVPYIEHVPPDTTAMIFWLKNRRPAQWRDKQDVQVDIHVSLAELVNTSYAPDLPALPAPKVIDHED